jgi:hypothetical protein
LASDRANQSACKPIRTVVALHQIANPFDQSILKLFAGLNLCDLYFEMLLAKRSFSISADVVSGSGPRFSLFRCIDALL